MFARGDGRPPLNKESFVYTRGESLVVGNANTVEVEVYSGGGPLEEIIRVPGYPLETPAEVRAALRDELLRMDAPEFIRNVNRQMAADIPETTPAYTGLLGDTEGNVWLRQYHQPSEPSVWLIFDQSGAWLGSGQLPVRFEPDEIGYDYILGHVIDEDGLESVAIRSLDRR